jgi:hypothetical protein
MTFVREDKDKKSFEDWKDWPFEHAPWSLSNMYADWKAERESKNAIIRDLTEEKPGLLDALVKRYAAESRCQKLIEALEELAGDGENEWWAQRIWEILAEMRGE